MKNTTICHNGFSILLCHNYDYLLDNINAAHRMKKSTYYIDDAQTTIEYLRADDERNRVDILCEIFIKHDMSFVFDEIVENFKYETMSRSLDEHYSLLRLSLTQALSESACIK